MLLSGLATGRAEKDTLPLEASRKKGRRSLLGWGSPWTMDRYSQLRARAAEFVAEWVQWGPVLVVAPVREAADEIALEACRDALIGVQRLAFRELVLELSNVELNRRALVPVGRIVREALAARVTQEAVAAGRLSYLGPVAAFPGFPRALADTFEELRLNTVGLDSACRVRRIWRGPGAAAERLPG